MPKVESYSDVLLPRFQKEMNNRKIKLEEQKRKIKGWGGNEPFKKRS